jgi:hypothetical protein
VLGPTDRPYGEVFKVFDFEVSSKSASGEREIVPSRGLDVGCRERKSRELAREVPPHFVPCPEVPRQVPENRYPEIRIFQWQTNTSASLRRTTKLLAFS